MRPLRRLFVLLCFGMFVSFLASETAGQTTSPQPRIVEAVDEAQLAVLKGNTHPLALPQYDRGAAPADLPMNRMLLVLKRSPEQEAALRKLLDDQQDKSSPSYHQWLTPDEFGRQFGPADQDMQVITSWIQSHGFEINSVSKGRTVIEFSGSAAQVQEAFHTAIHKFTVKGEDHWANASDPQIPTALTPVVAGVHTLHNFYKKPQIHLAEQKIAAQVLARSPGQASPGHVSRHPLVLRPRPRRLLEDLQHQPRLCQLRLRQQRPPRGGGTKQPLSGRVRREQFCQCVSSRRL